MLKIGITGGIGSGKTTVCKMFEALGVPVYYADDRAKLLMREDPDLIAALKSTFGAEVYLEDGSINRAYLSKLVFNDKSKLSDLNALVHPAVFRDAKIWQEEQKQAGHSYSMKEAALLFESGSYQQLDKIIVVTAPEEIRLQRVMQRDGVSKEQVLARMRNQMPQEEKEAKADFLIDNVELEDLKEEVMKVHQALLKLAQGE
jgi:dephospho-CoA kinase